MREKEIELSATIAAEAVVAAVNQAVATLGARITLDGTLRSHPGSRHWHVQAKGQTGTLEVTFWPSQNRLWVSLHAKREGSWAGQAFHPFVESLQTCLLSRQDQR